MDFNALNTFLLFGIIQGIVLTIVIFKHKLGNTLPYQCISLVVIVLTLATTGMFLFDTVDISHFSFSLELLFTYFPFEMVLFLGPAILLFSKSLSIRNYKVSKGDKLHFLPALLDIVQFVAAAGALLLYQIGIIKYTSIISLPSTLDIYESYLEIIRIGSVAVYVLLGIRVFYVNRSSINMVNYRWGQSILTGFGMVTLIWSTLLIYEYLPIRSELLSRLEYMPVYFPVVLFIYYLSIRFMIQSNPWRGPSIPLDELEQKAQSLNELMNVEKLYLNPDLKLDLLSEKSGIPEKTISRVLNNYYHKGFNDFINDYRVKDALEKMKSDVLKQKTLEGLAYEVGFSSRSTFYRAFKKVVGQQPSAFLKELN